jgi:hypothetical protein
MPESIHGGLTKWTPPVRDVLRLSGFHGSSPRYVWIKAESLVPKRQRGLRDDSRHARLPDVDPQ